MHINNDRQRKQSDSNCIKLEVFAIIVEDELKPVKQARLIKEQQSQQKIE